MAEAVACRAQVRGVLLQLQPPCACGAARGAEQPGPSVPRSDVGMVRGRCVCATAGPQ